MENAVSVDSILALIHEMSRESKEEMEQIRAMLKEREQEREKAAQEAKEEMKEIRAQSAEINKQIKETHKRISELGGRLGEIIEHIISPHLEEKFKRFGITLDTVIVEHKFEEQGRGIIAEVDVFLTNGEYTVAVEAKSKPSVRDVDDHVKRMKTLRAYADRHNDHRKYLGAIAGMVVPLQVKEYAFKQGFPVLIPSGDSIELECPVDFKPHEW